MAKQLGIHQIKGKVDGRSYYRQSGVVDGLSRNINPAISGRVKAGEEYANTRLNNREFGQACKIAAGLGRMVTPKYRPMILPFSQSSMAKKVLELIKADPTANVEWGFRGLAVDPLAVPVDALNAQAKVSFDTYLRDVTLSTSEGQQGEAVLAFGYSAQEGLADFLTAYGATGMYVKVAVWNFQYSRPIAAQLKDALVVFSGRNSVTGDEPLDFESTADELSYIPVSITALQHRAAAAIIICMPYREVGGVKHILQEICTFKAFNFNEPA